jgi:hypothetical protein
MTFLSNCKIENIKLDSVDLDNYDFKISRPCGEERFRESIVSSGILEMPVLFKKNNTYRIISGHNRLRVFKELNASAAGISIPCYVTDFPDADWFIGQAVLKSFRGETGPVGKCRFIYILKSKFSMNKEDIFTAAKKMQIPDEFADKNEKVLALPEPLKNYLDLKNIGFKIIKNILRLSDDTCQLLSGWLLYADIRVNIFKNIVDLLADIDKINKTNKMLPGLAGIDLAAAGDDNSPKISVRKDEMLFREIFKVRYPEYSDLKAKAEKIIKELSKDGLEIEFPEYFEKDEVGVLLKINKRNKIEGFNKVISRINTDALRKLLDLL